MNSNNWRWEPADGLFVAAYTNGDTTYLVSTEGEICLLNRSDLQENQYYILVNAGVMTVDEAKAYLMEVLVG